jgi:hypothetical protein
MDRQAEVSKAELRSEYGQRVEDALREVKEIQVPETQPPNPKPQTLKPQALNPKSNQAENEVLKADNVSLRGQRDMYRTLLVEADRSYLQVHRLSFGM